MQTNPTPHVVIVGAGFGGLNAARALASAPVRITLIDRRNYHLFQPLLYQVATAGLSPEDIAHPVRAILRRQKNLEFRLAEVTCIDRDARRLDTTAGTIAYDYLILAAGSQTNTFGLDGVARYGFSLKDLDEAGALRAHLLRQFELAVQERDPAARRQRLTFVVAGGGPTGVETAGALAELIRLALVKDFPREDFADARILLLEASDRLLPGIPTHLADAAERMLARRGVTVLHGARVTGYDGHQVTLQGDEPIPAATLIWTAGVRAVGLVDDLGAPQDRQGRVRVAATLQHPDYPEIFVIGDAASLEDGSGQPLPMVAPVAIQQAGAAARNVARLIAGREPLPFRYRDPGQLATVGRSAAVARLGRWEFTGFVAWVIWLGAHILKLIGFRNRLVVLVNWAWNYLTYDNAIRLIGPEHPALVIPPAAHALHAPEGAELIAKDARRSD